MRKLKLLSLTIALVTTSIILFLVVLHNKNQPPIFFKSLGLPRQPRVIGGYEISHKEYQNNFPGSQNPAPWFVTIVSGIVVWRFPYLRLWAVAQGQSCGGAAITPKILITAAHCVCSPRQDESELYSGLSNLMDFSNKPKAKVEFNYAYKINVYYNHFRSIDETISTTNWLGESIDQTPAHETDLFAIHPDYLNLDHKQGDIALVRLADNDFFDHRITRFASLPQLPKIDEFVPFSNDERINTANNFYNRTKLTPGIFDYEDYEVFRLQGYGLVEKDHIDHAEFDDYLNSFDPFHEDNFNRSGGNSTDEDEDDYEDRPEYIEDIEPLETPENMHYFDMKKISGQECMLYYLNLHYEKAMSVYGHPSNFSGAAYPDFYYDMPLDDRESMETYYDLSAKDFEWANMKPFYEKYFYQDPTHFCAVSAIKDSAQSTCSGDSGSPIMVLDTAENSYDEKNYNQERSEEMEVTDTIIGLVSSGFETYCMASSDNKNIANMYTNVVHYIPWIEKMIIGTAGPGAVLSGNNGTRFASDYRYWPTDWGKIQREDRSSVQHTSARRIRTIYALILICGAMFSIFIALQIAILKIKEKMQLRQRADNLVASGV